MSLTLQGIFYLIAVVLFVIAAILLWSEKPASVRVGLPLVALGLAVAFFVPMYNAFDAA